MSISFTSKRIRVTFTLKSGYFGDDPKNNSKVVEGLRVHCKVAKMGEPAKNECKLQIYGMLDSDMSQLSVLGYQSLEVTKNLIRVEAGDSDGLATAFEGEITGAWIVYHKPPELYFEVHAVAGYYPSVAPSMPYSGKGAVDVATAMQTLADAMGYSFKNNGVKGSIRDPYLSGSSYNQAQQLANAAGISFGVDDGELFIAPRGAYRQGIIAYTSPTSGMKDYPTFDKKGMIAEMQFNPMVQLNGQLHIEGSVVEKANGVWRVMGVEHDLVARSHTQGNWHTKAHLAIPGAL